MSVQLLPWGAGLLLVLAAMAASVAPSLPLSLAPTESPSSAALEAASASLAHGDGPAAGQALRCQSIGTLSVGCGVDAPSSSPATGTVGWARICAQDVCPPAARGGAGMAYDPITGYVVLFGGIVNLTTAANTTFGDTWIFQQGNWTHLEIHGPSARLGEYMAYDYSDHYIVMFGGGPYLTLNSSLYYSDTWTFQNGTWSELSLSVHPDARGLGGFTWDATDGYLLMYGGMTSQYDIHSDTWTFAHGQWTNLSLTVHPPPLLSPALAFDPATGYVLLYTGATPSAALEFGDDLEQTWSYESGVWTNLTPTIHSTLPEGRILSSMAYDPAQGFMVLYGGWNTTSNGIFGDTWVFSDDYWTLLFLSPTPAPASIGSNLISTTSGAGLLLFGGIVGSFTSYSATNATWIFGPPPTNTSAPKGGPQPTPYTVTFTSAPSSCPLPEILGTATSASGRTSTMLPGEYNATSALCDGYSFQGWFASPGIDILNPQGPQSAVDVLGNGSLIAYYEPDHSSALTLQPVDVGLAMAGVVVLALAAVWVHHRTAMRRKLSHLPGGPPRPPDEGAPKTP